MGYMETISLTIFIISNEIRGKELTPNTLKLF